METHFPPIERWWPGLSIEAKHSLQGNLDAPVGDVVIAEIQELLGCTVTDTKRVLTESERDFIRTQTEMVD